MATDVGIDPRYLRRAAAELEVGGVSTLWTRLAGAPVSFVLERTVRGELSESAFEDLVPLMQSAAIGQGNASAVGKTLTWSSRSDSDTSSQPVLVSSRNGETMVRIEERVETEVAGRAETETVRRVEGASSGWKNYGRTGLARGEPFF